MKATLLFVAIILAAALCGCGDPAPSTPLAPDMQTAASSSSSSNDLAKIKAEEHGASASGGAATSPGGGTPPDRTMPGG